MEIKHGIRKVRDFTPRLYTKYTKLCILPFENSFKRKPVNNGYFFSSLAVWFQSIR